jgi:hypothetical protein
MLVTEAIEYNNAPHLTEFFHRYSEALPEMCGKDHSVLDPTPAEAVKARQALNLDNTVPLVKLTVPDMDSSPIYYIVASPQVTPYTPPGHATCAFPAYNVSRCMPVFIKNSWRVDVPDISAEGLIYNKLKEDGVCHVPNCLSSGDIRTKQYHATKTCMYANVPWACYSTAHFVPHRHYYLTLDIIRRSLTTF